MGDIEKLKAEIRAAIDRSGVNLANVNSLLDEISAEVTKKILSGVDWERLDAMTDADIDRQIAENPDAAPIADEGFFDRARIVQPGTK